MEEKKETKDPKQQELIPVPQAVKAGQESKAGFADLALVATGDLSAQALAAQATAQIQARYVMALRKPRDIMVAREKILADSKRPAFAKTAIYHKPIGKGVEGPSIRLAEALGRAMTNILTDVTAVYDDDSKRVVRIIATDLEANLTFTKDVTVKKQVERLKAEGRKVVSQRINSKGATTYLVEATDDEIMDHENALVSKNMRTCLLRLMPGDLLDEAVQQCYATMAAKDAEDPLAAQKEMLDDFGKLGVTVEQLVAYLGHPVDQTAPTEMRVLRGIFSAIEAGESTWQEAIDAAGGEKAKPEEKKAEPQSLTDVAKAAKEEKKGKKPEPPEPGSNG